MSKTASEITTNGKACFYTILWPSFRRAAIDCGWTVALHGSMATDMDMIAIPWTIDAKPVEEFVKAMSDCIGKTIWKDRHFEPFVGKPHGRIVYTLSIFSDFYIDLSIMKGCGSISDGEKEEMLVKSEQAFHRWLNISSDYNDGPIVYDLLKEFADELLNRLNGRL